MLFSLILHSAEQAGELRGGGGGRGWGVFNINMGTKLNQKRSGSNGENTFQG